MNKEEIKVMIKDCVYSEDGITYMSDKQYNNYIDIIEQLQQENKQLKERYENLTCGYIFLNNRVKQGMNNANKNICLIELGNQILREIESGDSNE